MGQAMIKLMNETDSELHLKERQKSAPEGYYTHHVKVAPRSVKSIPAAIYRDRNRASGRCSEVDVFLSARGIEHVLSLTPETFLLNSHLKFEFVGDAPTLTGIPAHPFHLSQIRGFGCIGSNQVAESVVEEVLITQP